MSFCPFEKWPVRIISDPPQWKHAASLTATSVSVLLLAPLQVFGVVGIICAGIYPTVIVPLQIAYGGAPRPVGF